MLSKFDHVFITGASRGLGLSFIEVLLDKYKVRTLSLCARNFSSSLDFIKYLCKTHNVRLNILSFDIRDTVKLKAFIDECDKKDNITLLIANAGVSVNSEKLLENDVAINRCFDINTKSSILAIYYVLDKMLERKHGHIVAISSLASIVALPSSESYSASKMALSSYLDSIRFKLDSFNRKNKDSHIFISKVLLGFVKTDMSDRFIGKKVNMISSNKAASIILKNVYKNKYNIILPFYIYVFLNFVNCMPFCIKKILLKPFTFKVIEDKSYDKEDN